MWPVVTNRAPAIDFSTFPDSDGQPVAENRRNLTQMTDLIFALEHYLAPRVRFAVGGNQFIYYNPADGRQHVSPDVYAALEVAPGVRQKWQTWLEGGTFPQVVLEITSESTQEEDLGPKVRLYERLGVHEYYIYDPEGLLSPPLHAYQRIGRTLVAQPLLAGPAIHSPLLGTELRVVGDWLRLIDPASGRPVPVPEEEHARAEHEAQAARTARAEVQAARAQVQAAHAQVRAAQTRADEAQARAAEEARARRAGEEQARQTQQALQEALAELARLRGEQPS